MLVLSKNLLNRPVMSLRTGAQVATATAPIINPNNLKIEGFYCEDKFSKETLVLLAVDIRDILPQGFVINDHEVLASPDELVRLKEVLNLTFELLGKPVVTVSKTRLGRVNDYAADDSTLHIQKLYVSQSLLKSFSGGQLSIDRNNIVEITNRKIVTQEILTPTKVPLTATNPI